MRIIGMKIGEKFREVTNVSKLIEALKLNKSIGLDCETFYKKSYDVPYKKGKLEVIPEPINNVDDAAPAKGKRKKKKQYKAVIDWSQLNPTTGEIRSIQIYLPLQQTSVLITGDGLDNAADHPLVAAILDHVQDTSKETVIHNFLYESQWFLTKFAVPILNGFCTQVASQVATAGLQYFISAKYGAANSLGVAVRRYMGIKIDKSQQDSNWGSELTTEQILYGLLDPYWCWELKRILVLQPGVMSAAGDAEQACLPVFGHLNTYGIPADIKRLRELEMGYKAAAHRLSLELMSVAYAHIDSSPGLRESLIPKNSTKKERENWVFNLNSHQQMLKLVNSILEKEGKKPVTSTKASVLEEIQTEFTLAVCKYRSMEKLLSYAVGFIKSYNPATGRVCGSYKSLAAQATGRSACTKPSLQIVPNNTPLTKAFKLKGLKSAFMPTKGKVMLKSDLNTSHGNLAIAFSNDPVLVDATLKGEKLHYHTMVSILALMGRPLSFDTIKGIIEETIESDELEWFQSIYTGAKNTFYSYLNFAGAKSLKMTLAKKGILQSLEDCALFLKACRQKYSVLYAFQKQLAYDAEKSISKVFDSPLFNIGVYEKTKVYGVAPASSRPIFLGNACKITVPDGRIVMQPAIIKKDIFTQYLNYLSDGNGEEVYDWTTRASQVVSAQWLGTEATIIKTAMRRIYDAFRANPEWGAEIIAFAHDEVLSQCLDEHKYTVKKVIDDIITEEFRKYCDLYPENKTKFLSDWATEIH